MLCDNHSSAKKKKHPILAWEAQHSCVSVVKTMIVAAEK